MLIKDDDGDWGLCAAAWKGMVSGRPGVPGKPGNLLTKMFYKNITQNGLFFRATRDSRHSWQTWPFQDVLLELAVKNVN